MPDLSILVHIIQTLLIHALHHLCDVADQDLMVRILTLHSLKALHSLCEPISDGLDILIVIVELASLLVHQVRNDLLQLGLDLIKDQSKLLVDDATLDLNTTVAWLASLRVVGCISH